MKRKLEILYGTKLFRMVSTNGDLLIFRTNGSIKKHIITNTKCDFVCEIDSESEVEMYGDLIVAFNSSKKLLHMFKLSTGSVLIEGEYNSYAYFLKNALMICNKGELIVYNIKAQEIKRINFDVVVSEMFAITYGLIAINTYNCMVLINQNCDIIDKLDRYNYEGVKTDNYIVLREIVTRKKNIYSIDNKELLSKDAFSILGYIDDETFFTFEKGKSSAFNVYKHNLDLIYNCTVDEEDMNKNEFVIVTRNGIVLVDKFNTGKIYSSNKDLEDSVMEVRINYRVGLDHRKDRVLYSTKVLLACGWLVGRVHYVRKNGKYGFVDSSLNILKEIKYNSKTELSKEWSECVCRRT